METKLMHVYPARCTACRNCELVCSFSHSFEGKPTPSRITAFLDEQQREGKNEIIVCMQCDSAACVAACPSNALHRNMETGAVYHVKDRCIRCGSCVAACPFGNMHWSDPEELPVKCDLCGGDPLCVRFCPARAIEYR
jgi:carbon-monoxide dehydrogenase iron sulfur subunit